jgi:hypothetical protein
VFREIGSAELVRAYADQKRRPPRGFFASCLSVMGTMLRLFL